VNRREREFFREAKHDPVLDIRRKNQDKSSTLNRNLHGVSPMKSFPCLILCAAAVCLLALPGCDDPEARERASSANSQINALKEQIETLKKQNEATVASIAEVEKRLAGKVDKRMDELAASVAANHQALLDRMKVDAKTIGDTAQSLATAGTAEANKELTATKNMVAESMQTMRTEMNAELDKLRKFMDNQLKEVYPYAYQPRRLDPNAPPESAPDAKKEKEGGAAPEQK